MHVLAWYRISSLAPELTIYSQCTVSVYHHLPPVYRKTGPTIRCRNCLHRRKGCSLKDEKLEIFKFPQIVPTEEGNERRAADAAAKRASRPPKEPKVKKTTNRVVTESTITPSLEATPVPEVAHVPTVATIPEIAPKKKVNYAKKVPPMEKILFEGDGYLDPLDEPLFVGPENRTTEAGTQTCHLLDQSDFHFSLPDLRPFQLREGATRGDIYALTYTKMTLKYLIRREEAEARDYYELVRERRYLARRMHYDLHVEIDRLCGIDYSPPCAMSPLPPPAPVASTSTQRVATPIPIATVTEPAPITEIAALTVEDPMDEDKGEGGSGSNGGGSGSNGGGNEEVIADDDGRESWETTDSSDDESSGED